MALSIETVTKSKLWICSGVDAELVVFVLLLGLIIWVDVGKMGEVVLLCVLSIEVEVVAWWYSE